MEYLTENLLKKKPFAFDSSEKAKGGLFYDSLMEELQFHYDNNALYRSFCEKKGFNPHGFAGCIDEIPPIQVSVFKELGDKLASVPNEKIKLMLRSSATSGVPSSVLIDFITSRRQVRSMTKVVAEYIGNDRKPFIIMDVDPSLGFKEILGARYAAVSGYLNFASDVGYFLKVNDKRQYYFDLDGLEKFIDNLNGRASVVFGFTYILYSEVIYPLTKKGAHFILPEGSKVIHIGGWKKLENEKVDKGEFNRLTSKLFGIEEKDIIDIYGFTEQMGLNYPDCQCGCKHTPLYSEIIIRDVMTKKVLPQGEGLIEFVTPIPHSYPGNAVLTDDIGVIVDGECPYGRSGKRFKVVGRLKNAEIRGCGDVLSDKLKFTDSNINTGTICQKESFRVYYNGVSTYADKDEDVILEISTELKSRLSWLRKQPIDALIGIVAQAAKKWDNMSSEFSAIQNQGLQFLSSWCKPENLTRIANEGLRGNRRYADGFIPMGDSGVRLLRATSRGLVCHWLAGNVQVLGMFVLIQSILTGNVNLMRVSRRDNGIMESLVASFNGESYTTPGGYTIKGDDILKTIALVFFDHMDKKAGIKMSELADVRIAWGGAEAVSTVAAYPSKYDCTDIIMGPKISMSVVSSEAIADGRKAKKLARRIAVDACVFDQTGCASAHNVFVESGNDITPQEFASFLAEGMEKVSRQIPKARMTPEEFAAVHSARAVFDFKGRVFGDDDSVWTVLYEDMAELNKPVYSRVLFVHPVSCLDEVIEFISDDIQTIGLAASGEKALNFATAAAEKGALRFPAPGRMLNYEVPWDGFFIMDRLVKWNTLGGPLI